MQPHTFRLSADFSPTLDESNLPLRLTGPGAHRAYTDLLTDLARREAVIVAANGKGLTGDLIGHVRRLLDRRSEQMISLGAVNYADLRASRPGTPLPEVVVGLAHPPREVWPALAEIAPTAARSGVLLVVLGDVDPDATTLTLTFGEDGTVQTDHAFSDDLPSQVRPGG